MDKDTTTPSVVAGNQATYAIVVRNNGGSAATGVTVADTLPAGFTYASSSVVETSATRTATSNPTVGDNALSFGTWTINAGGQIADHRGRQRGPGNDAGDVRQHGQRQRQQPCHHQ